MGDPVSVVLPFYGGLGLFDACYESLVSTLRPEDEVIVVVNSDDPALHGLSFEDQRFKLLEFRKPIGHARAANEGASVAKNDYLVISDHDLVFKKGWLEALWRFYETDDALRAVSCCVLNSHTNRILDFGIAYNAFNGAHPHLDLPATHPLVSRDRVAQAVCTGGMLIARKDFESLGGFDEVMQTLYSDVDLCLRLKAAGFNVGAARGAIAYHFGGDFSQINRNYKSTALKSDVKGYFMRKNAHILEYDLHLYFKESAAHAEETNGAFRKYFFCGMMNVVDQDWYYELAQDLGISAFDSYTRPTGQRDSGLEGIYETLGHSIVRMHTPIAYFVDRFVSLRQNAVWWAHRPHRRDIVIDRNANIVSVENLLKDMATQYP